MSEANQLQPCVRFFVLAGSFGEYKNYTRFRPKGVADKFKYVSRPMDTRGYDVSRFVVLDDFYTNNGAWRIFDEVKALGCVEWSAADAMADAFVESNNAVSRR